MAEMNEKVREWAEKFKFPLLIMGLGLVLILFSGGSGESTASTSAVVHENGNYFDLSAFEKQLAETLSQIEGAGTVTVQLSLEATAEQVYATDTERQSNESKQETVESVVLYEPVSGTESPLQLREISPVFRGATVVASGAENASVKAQIVNSVSALTGLGTDKISVCKGK